VKPGSKSENVKWRSTRHGCAKGMNDCDVGKMTSRLESYGQSLRQRSHHVTRRTTPRPGETNDAPVDQASSTSAATAWLSAEHDVCNLAGGILGLDNTGVLSEFGSRRHAEVA